MDALLESPFAKKADENARPFETREQICDYLHLMLTHKFFHRARKVPVDERELEKSRKGKKKKSDKTGAESADDEKAKEKKEGEKDKGTDAESSVVEGNKEPQVTSNLLFFTTTKVCV